MILVATILWAILSGVTFLFALYWQFAMVGVAASLATGVPLYRSTVGDVSEGRKQGSNRKLIASVALTAGGLIGFLVKRYAGF